MENRGTCASFWFCGFVAKLSRTVRHFLLFVIHLKFAMRNFMNIRIPPRGDAIIAINFRDLFAMLKTVIRTLKFKEGGPNTINWKTALGNKSGIPFGC